MFKIGELAVRLAELAEAEGRLARHHAFRLAGAILLLAMGLVVALVGLLMLLGGGYLALAWAMHSHPAALVIVGVVAILIGLAMAAAAHRHQCAASQDAPGQRTPATTGDPNQPTE